MDQVSRCLNEEHGDDGINQEQSPDEDTTRTHPVQWVMLRLAGNGEAQQTAAGGDQEDAPCEVHGHVFGAATRRARFAAVARGAWFLKADGGGLLVLQALKKRELTVKERVVCHDPKKSKGQGDYSVRSLWIRFPRQVDSTAWT